MRPNVWGPLGRLKILLSHRFFALMTSRNCLKFIFTPSLLNHAGCQIDLSGNNAIFSIRFPFLCFEICLITPSCFPLGGACMIYFSPWEMWHVIFMFSILTKISNIYQHPETWLNPTQEKLMQNQWVNQYLEPVS